jgi:hypothetical protein
VKRLRNSILFGVFCGIIGTLIGTLIYYLFLRHAAEPLGSRGITDTLSEFLRNARASRSLHMVLSIGAIFNLLVFFVFVWTKSYRAGYGVIYATIGWLVVLGAMALFL